MVNNTNLDGIYKFALETNLENALGKRKRPVATNPAQRPTKPVRGLVVLIQSAQQRPKAGEPRALALLQKRAHTIRQSSDTVNHYFIRLKLCTNTLKSVVFATGGSPVCPRTTAWHTGDNYGYAGHRQGSSVTYGGRASKFWQRASRGGG